MLYNYNIKYKQRRDETGVDKYKKYLGKKRI